MTPFFVMLAELDRAAHDSAFGRNLLPTPSEAQCQAGNYRVGRVNIHGLPVSIEQPRDSVRCGTDASGKAWRSRMAAHYGYINGTTGADGDHVDCFIGDWPISNTVWVINQHIDGKFDEHKVMLLFNREDMARAAYLDSYEPGWNGIGSMIKLTPTQLSFWLKSGDMSKPLTSDQLFNEGFHPMNTTDPTWDSGAHVARAWYDVERLASGMDVHELHEPLTVCDAIAGGQLLPRFDALVVTMGKAQAKLAAMQSVLARQGSTLSVVGMQITDPFRQAGTTNIVAIYELSDGQTVSIYLHNPDTTPNKLAPTDAMVAWKWLLNRRDVTAVVSPEKGQELSPLTIGRRVMALAEKNSPAFVKANANRAEKLKALDALVSEVAGLTTRKRLLEVELGTLDIELVDAVAQKQAARRAARKQAAAVVAPVVDGTGEAEQAQDKQQSTVWWKDNEYMRKVGYTSLYMIGKSKGKEYVAIKVDGGGYKVTMARAGMLFETQGNQEEIVYWLREKLAGMGDGLLGRVLPMDSLTSMLKLVFGDDVLFSRAQQEAASGDIDPTSPDGYAKVMADEVLQLKFQDVLDAFFQERIVAVRNALKGMGWEGRSPADARLYKPDIDAEVQPTFVHTGAGRNVVGWSMNDIQDDLSKTPEDYAAMIDQKTMAEVAKRQPDAPPPENSGQPEQKPIDYSKMFDPMTIKEMNVVKHLHDSVLAAQHEGNDEAIIEPDRILSLFVDTLTAQQFKSYDHDKAEGVLFAKLREVEQELGFGLPAVPETDQDPLAAADRSLFQSIIDGTVPDLLSPELASKFEAAGERREKDPGMKSLFEQAVNVYQEAMLAATANLA